MSVSVESYQKAYRKIEIGRAKNSFVAHLVVYTIVNLLLIAINVFFSHNEGLWFIWPLAGWGIGLFMHYLYGVQWIERDLEMTEALAEKLAREDSGSTS